MTNERVFCDVPVYEGVDDESKIWSLACPTEQ
ncbi:MAG: hypothetical protein ACI8T1_001266 [Verrucomicrobiales bacterium]|jgi:hypothetical protein